MLAKYWLLLIVVLLVGCNEKGVDNQQALTLMTTPAWQLSLNNDTAPVETPLTLSLLFNNDKHHQLQKIEADIVGISMYMGKVPLRFTADNTTNGLYRAEFLLGACSEANMQWQLNIKLRYNDGSIETNSSTFYSSW